MHRLRLPGLNVKLVIAIANADQVSLFDPQQTRQPLRNHDLQEIPGRFRNAQRTLRHTGLAGI